MIYKVKWIEEHLGISRKALRVYEAKGLVSPSRNKHNGKYREYSHEDIIKVWNIRILRELGYSLDEIRRILEDPDTDFLENINRRISKLDKIIEDNCSRRKLLQAIKADGHFPDLPENFGEITIIQYIKQLTEKENNNEEK